MKIMREFRPRTEFYGSYGKPAGVKLKITSEVPSEVDEIHEIARRVAFDKTIFNKVDEETVVLKKIEDAFPVDNATAKWIYKRACQLRGNDLGWTGKTTDAVSKRESVEKVTEIMGSSMIPYRFPTIRTTYEIWSEEAAEAGDTDERGWFDEEGEVFSREEDPEENGTVAERAASFLKDKGATNPSQSPTWGEGTWYTDDGDQDYQTGDIEYRSYHLEGFTPQEGEEIYALVTGRGSRSPRMESKSKDTKKEVKKPKKVKESEKLEELYFAYWYSGINPEEPGLPPIEKRQLEKYKGPKSGDTKIALSTVASYILAKIPIILDEHFVKGGWEKNKSLTERAQNAFQTMLDIYDISFERGLRGLEKARRIKKKDYISDDLYYNESAYKKDLPSHLTEKVEEEKEVVEESIDRAFYSQYMKAQAKVVNTYDLAPYVSFLLDERLMGDSRWLAKINTSSVSDLIKLAETGNAERLAEKAEWYSLEKTASEFDESYDIISDSDILYPLLESVEPEAFEDIKREDIGFLFVKYHKNGNIREIWAGTGGAPTYYKTAYRLV